MPAFAGTNRVWVNLIVNAPTPSWTPPRRRCWSDVILRATNISIEGAAVQPGEIATPAALIDEARMMRNIARMQDRMRALGVRLRPHVKTPKCIEVARHQQAAGADGITVSTLKEAEQ